MAIGKIFLAIVILASSTRCDNDALPKPSYTRTLLKVARSYPGETEELKVRTSQGNLATLIVKRRNKSSPFTDNPSNNYNNYGQLTTLSGAEDNGPETRTSIGFKNVDVDPWKRRKVPNPADSRNSADKYSFHQDTKSWVPINNNPDESTSERYFSWKPVQTYENVPASSDGSYRNFGTTADVSATTDDSPVRWSFNPNQRLRTNIGANIMKNRGSKNVPPEVSIRSEINVKGSSQSTQRTPMLLTANNSMEIHGKRVPDDPTDKYQIWRNAKVINNQLVMDNSPTTHDTRVTDGNIEQNRNFERFIEDVNRRYGQNQADESRKFSSQDVLRTEVYETARDTYRPNIRKRMLQPEIAAIYPNSRIYTPESHKAPPMNLKSGVRAPVLQYAHPELGVQPAKVAKNEKRQPVVNYSETYSYPEQRHKKKYVLNDKNLVDSYTVKNYYPNQHFYGLKRPIETPFWIKISENLRNQFTEGVAKVSEMTKPVIDPLVEATRKISQNLGLSRRQDVAQDKIGSVAAGSSSLIPALGLVASGAALGIGAIAVGRYLDVDVLKRSNKGANVDFEQTRALDSLSSYPVEDRAGEIFVGKNPTNDLYVMAGDQRHNTQQVKRTRRSLDFVDDLEDIDTVPNKSAQRKGADLIAEIVEIDVPSRFQQAKQSKGQEVNDIDDEESARRIVDEVISALGRGPLNKWDFNGKPLNVEKSDDEYVRRRRNLDESDQEVNDELQNLENAKVAKLEHIPGDWTNTPCAKRIFCEAMIKKGSEAVILMEKKMDNILTIIQRAAVDQVSIHLDQVMDAVRRHDCSVFSCPQDRLTQVFY